jgi:hypothetical protein
LGVNVINKISLQGLSSDWQVFPSPVSSSRFSDLQGLYCGDKTVFHFDTGLPNMVQRAATHIARKAVELDIVPGRSPISVAAAAIYMASQVCIEHVNPK